MAEYIQFQPNHGAGSRAAADAAPASEVDVWTEGLAARFSAATVGVQVRSGSFYSVARDALVAPTTAALVAGEHTFPANTTIAEIAAFDVELALEILEARHEAMQEFFDSWFESMAANAAADKKQARKRLLATLHGNAMAVARNQVVGWGAGGTNQVRADREGPERRTNTVLDEPAGTIAAGGVKSALREP